MAHVRVFDGGDANLKLASSRRGTSAEREPAASKTEATIYTEAMSHRTSIELDEMLLEESRRILGTTGIRDTVEAAFREIIRADRRHRLRERIRTGDGMDTGPAMLAAVRPAP